MEKKEYGVCQDGLKLIKRGMRPVVKEWVEQYQEFGDTKLLIDPKDVADSGLLLSLDSVEITKETGHFVRNPFSALNLRVREELHHDWNVVFVGRGGQEVIRIEGNGDIYVKGNLIENDVEVVEGMRDLINQNNSMREELNNGR